MHPTAGNLKLKIAILAAIFAATLACVMIVARAVAPGASPVKDEARKPHAAKTTIVAAAAKTKKVYPVGKKDEIKPLLHPATVAVSRPTAVRLGEAVPITLKITPDRSGKTKAAFPMPGDRLTAVSSSVSGGNTVSVYETQVSDSVVTKLFGGDSGSLIPAHEGEEPLLVPEEGVAWNWRVPATEPGNAALEFEMVAHVQVGGTRDSWPAGTLALELPIVPTWLQWLGYYFAQLGSLWNWLVGLATGVVAVTAAVPILNKWLPHRAAAPAAADAKVVS
jgi:hypothetical protein